jgi:hypothetical protein
MRPHPGATSPAVVQTLRSMEEGISRRGGMPSGARVWLLDAGRACTGQKDGQRVAVAAELEVLADQLVKEKLVVVQSRPDIVLCVRRWASCGGSTRKCKGTGAWLASFAHRLVDGREDFGLHARSYIAKYALGLERFAECCADWWHTIQRSKRQKWQPLGVPSRSWSYAAAIGSPRV